MEDVVEALVRLIARAVGEVVRVLAYLLWELLIHGSARLIYGHGDRPRHRIQRSVFRIVALGSGAVAIHGLAYGVPEAAWEVLGFFLTMFALLVMLAGEQDYGHTGLFWLACFALLALFGALGVAVMN